MVAQVERDINRTEVDSRMLVFKLNRSNGSVVLVLTLYSFPELLRAIQLGVPYHATTGDHSHRASSSWASCLKHEMVT